MPIDISFYIRWAFFHSQSTSSRRENFMATDMGTNQEIKNIIWLTNWRRIAKRKFQGIHDRFLVDHDFRARMIENNWDEEVCRRWDVLADENHTHHLSEQGNFYYKNKWWFHLKSRVFWHPNIEKTFWFQPSIVYLGTFTPRNWRKTIRAHLFV